MNRHHFSIIGLCMFVLYIAGCTEKVHPPIAIRSDFSLTTNLDTVPEAQELQRVVKTFFADMQSEELALGNALGEWKELLPCVQLPRIEARISLFSTPIVVSDAVVWIGVDNYLGAENSYYAHLYPYQRILCERERIPYDVVLALLYTRFKNKGDATLLDGIIYEGKVRYALALLFPEATDAQIMGYSSAQIAWCKQYEKNIWQEIIRQKQLFDTTPLLRAKYLQPAPFTAPLGDESPPRVGQWIGWQLVKSYCRNYPNKTLQELFSDPIHGAEWLKLSKYKE